MKLFQKNTIILGLLVLVAFGAVRTLSAGEEKPKRPNILFLMADQFRGDCLGADGNRAIITPNLDRLAAEGARFRSAYSSTPSCTPARSAILTGLSPWHHGMLGYGAVAERYPRELPRMIREAGYHTQGIGKMHFHPQRNTHGYHKTILDEEGRVESPGFQSDYRRWFRSVAPDMNPDATGVGWNDYHAKVYALLERLHPTRWTGDEAVKFIEQYEGESPFLLKVSFARPHSPYDPPQRWWDRYEGAELPEAVVGDWAERHTQRNKPHKSTLWQGDLGAEKVRLARRGYYGNVSFIDEQIGRILDALEKRGWLENTFVIFFADHGDMLGDHNLWRKTYAYESSARVPMLIRWPEGMLDARRGQVIEAPVELRDVLPTFLEVAGAEYDPEWFDGRSMLQLIRGDREGWRDWIDLEHATCYDKNNVWTSLTDGRIKYIYYAYEGREQLFDLTNDPHETKDLAASPEHKILLETWRGRMIKHLTERGEPFVVDGRLGIRRKKVLYSPNFPR